MCHRLSYQCPNRFFNSAAASWGGEVQFMLVNSCLWKICSGSHTSIRIVFVICNKLATNRAIKLINRIQHARYEHHIVAAANEGLVAMRCSSASV
jgi:hypothetical protein